MNLREILSLTSRLIIYKSIKFEKFDLQAVKRVYQNEFAITTRNFIVMQVLYQLNKDFKL